MESWTILNLFVGASLLLIGYQYRFQTPRYGSRWFGILHPVARRSEAVWMEAHRYLSGLLLTGGSVALLLALLPYLELSFTPRKFPSMLVVGFSLMAINLTLRHIEKHFDENGNPRS